MPLPASRASTGIQRQRRHVWRKCPESRPAKSSIPASCRCREVPARLPLRMRSWAAPYLPIAPAKSKAVERAQASGASERPARQRSATRIELRPLTHQRLVAPLSPTPAPTLAVPRRGRTDPLEPSGSRPGYPERIVRHAKVRSCRQPRRRARQAGRNAPYSSLSGLPVGRRRIAPRQDRQDNHHPVPKSLRRCLHCRQAPPKPQSPRGRRR